MTPQQRAWVCEQLRAREQDWYHETIPATPRPIDADEVIGARLSACWTQNGSATLDLVVRLSGGVTVSVEMCGEWDEGLDVAALPHA